MDGKLWTGAGPPAAICAKAHLVVPLDSCLGYWCYNAVVRGFPGLLKAPRLASGRSQWHCADPIRV
jgi:hypothetical protein